MKAFIAALAVLTGIPERCAVPVTAAPTPQLTGTHVRWGAYGGREGPMVEGKHGYALPARPTAVDGYVRVLAAAERSEYDSVNMYDRGIVSVGIVQWIEAGQQSVAGLLGHTIEKCGRGSVAALEPVLAAGNARLERGNDGRWAFHTRDGPVHTRGAARALFFSGASGRSGSWTTEEKKVASAWAASLSLIWSDECARRAQHTYAARTTSLFVRPFARKYIYAGRVNGPAIMGWRGAVRAAYYSYAVNNPTVADAAARRAHAAHAGPVGSRSWALNVLYELALASGRSHHARRYDRIRPVVEAIYAVDLPNTATDLRRTRHNHAEVNGGLH